MENPGLKLVRLASTTVDNQVQVTAEYDMKAVSAKLYLEYVINNQGAVKITQKMTADKNAKVSPMFRFGMQMQMPKNFNTIEFYGRGPVENYSDRNHSTDLGIYRQSVDEQFYSYIRPQNRKQDRHPLVETVECRRQWREDCSRSSFLCLCIALHHRITG